MIRYFQQEIRFDFKSKRIIKQWIKSVIEQQNKKCGDINIIFCSDPSILEINNRFLKHNYYTDIITFDYCENEIISGELYISIDTVRANAVEYEQLFDVELHRVIIHGILHLLGWNDHTEKETAKMRRAENDALVLLESFFKETRQERR